LRAYGDTRWWVLLLYLATSAGLVLVAGALRARRDLGAGIVAPRPGPESGSPRLADAIALGVRVHTPMLIGWTVSIAALGLVFGAISPSFDAFDSAGVRDMLERIGGAGALRDTLLGAVVSLIALMVTCFAIAVVSHGGSDERDGRTEEVLATATSRSRAFLATAIVGLGGATWLLLVAGIALALGVGTDTDHSFGRLVASAVAQAPAVWVVVALAVLCFALRSQWAVLGCGVVVVFATLGQIGALLGLPQWVLDLSPYSHAPRMPRADFDLGPALVLTGIAAVLLAASWLRYRRRDIG
jgi:ABC-2 type transport system permease protein